MFARVFLSNTPAPCGALSENGVTKLLQLNIVSPNVILLHISSLFGTIPPDISASSKKIHAFIFSLEACLELSFPRY